MHIISVNNACAAPLNGVGVEHSASSRTMLSQAAKTQRAAVCWSHHLSDPEKDEKDVFSGRDALTQRTMLFDQMTRYGKNVVNCEGVRSFHDYLGFVNQSNGGTGLSGNRTVHQIDTLLIRAHGNVKCVGDLFVKEHAFSKDEVAIDSAELSETERSDFMSQLAKAMQPESVVILDSCLAGNKTVNNNFAAVLSRQLPGVKVIAAQECIVPRYKRATGLILDYDIKTQQVDHARMTAQSDIPGKDEVERYTVAAVEYVDGKELTGQEAVDPKTGLQRENVSKFEQFLKALRFK